VQPILQLLDGYIADPAVKAYDLNAPERPLVEIAARLCAEHASDDLALLHAYFERRAAVHPSRSAVSNRCSTRRHRADARPPGTSRGARSIVRPLGLEAESNCGGPIAVEPLSHLV
jgi:hypothetical protein